MNWKSRLTKRELEVLDKVLLILRKKLKPKRIILFGSRVKDNPPKHTDFDLALDCRTPSLLEKAKLDEQIDEVSGLYKVDLVFLDEVDKEFREIILTTGKVVYEKRN